MIVIEMNIGDRLRMFRKSKNLAVVEFSQLVGVSKNSIYTIENNKTNISSKIITALIRNTDINIYWLMTGEGEMIRNKSDITFTPFLNDEYGIEVDPELAELRRGMRRILKKGRLRAYEIQERNLEDFDYGYQIKDLISKMESRLIALEKYEDSLSEQQIELLAKMILAAMEKKLGKNN